MTIIEERTMNAIINACNVIQNKFGKDKKIDWEQRRYEIAKDMFTATHFGSNNGSPCGCMNDNDGYEKKMASKALRYADALIEELKKQN